MNRDRNGSKGADSSTAESRTKGTAQKRIQLALVISLDQKNTPSELEKALEVDSKMPERGVDIGDYTLVPLTSLSQVIDFIHQSPETLQSVGLVAYYDSHLDKEVISAMIGRLCSLIDPNAVKAHYVGNGTGPKLVSIEVDKQSHETTYRAPVVDPLYSHVRLTFREGKTVLWLPEYVIKSMHDDFRTGLSVGDIALLNEAAMRYYHFGVPTFADLNSGKVLMEHVGLISYELIRDIKNSKKKAYHEQPRRNYPETIRILDCVKNLLVYTQLRMLAEHQEHPFIPKKSDGSEINMTPKLRDYYKKTLAAALNCETDPVRREAFDISIQAFLNLLERADQREVRYLDMYQRNNGIHDPEVSSLEELVKAISGLTPTEQAKYFKSHLKQVDVHRILRTAYDLEDFWHAISDPGLEMTHEEELKWYYLFLGIKELIHEQSQCPPNKRKIDALKKIVDNPERVSYDELKGLLTTNSVDLQYFYAMKLFRAIRWFDLIGDKYIPKYEARREEACSGFDLLLKDDFARKHRTTIDYFMNGTDKAPPGRLMFIRCITDKLTRQEAEEIIRLGIIYDGAQAGDRANEIFLTERHIAEGIARINTLAGCSARLSRYRSDFNAYNATSNRSFNQIMSLCLSDMQSMVLDLGFTKYELSRRKKRIGSYTLIRGNEPVKTIEQYISALKEIGRTLTPSSEPFYNAVKISCLKALYGTNSLNVGGA